VRAPGPVPLKGLIAVNRDDHLTLTNPADAAALVPYLLGFHPHDRLVILTLRDARIHFTAAAALPVDTATSLAGLVADKEPDQVLLFGYGHHDPVAAAVERTTSALHTEGIPVLNAFRIHDNRIWHLSCTDVRCHYDGTPFDPDNTVAAAYATYHGLTAATDIQALAAGLDPVTGLESAAMVRAYHRASRHIDRLIDGCTNQQTTDRIHALLDELLAESIHAYQTGRLTDDRAALLNVLLGLPQLRHRAVRHVDGDDLHLRIWTDLTRRATPECLAGPATLLAVAALQIGHGTLARLAIQRAHHADPTDPLIDALADCVRHGVHPDTVHRLLHE
jgi:hypothetical protein